MRAHSLDPADIPGRTDPLMAGETASAALSLPPQRRCPVSVERVKEKSDHLRGGLVAELAADTFASATTTPSS